MAVIVVCALLVWVVAVETTTDVPALGTLSGMLLILLGFEALTHWRPGGPA